MAHFEAIIDSMTPAERADPKILNGSRRARVARGSGRPVQEVNQLVRQFQELRKMMKNSSVQKLLGGLK
jgi:signal recognition particle subunit SRP54